MPAASARPPHEPQDDCSDRRALAIAAAALYAAWRRRADGRGRAMTDEDWPEIERRLRVACRLLKNAVAGG
jgi:hypothetical protein